jgi:small-conductance mechanosensitive channel
MRAPLKLLLAVQIVTCAGPLPVRAAAADENGARAQSSVAELDRLLSSPDVTRLLRLLNDPEVRAELAKAAMRASGPAPVVLGQRLQVVLTNLRTRAAGFAAALGRLPADLRHMAGRSAGPTLPNEFLSALAGFVALVGIGVLVELTVIRLTAGWRARVIRAPQDTPRRRAGVILQRFLYGLVMLGAWSGAALGAFTLVPWRGTVAALVLSYLSAALLVAASLIATRFLLAPGAPRFRLLPLPTRAARFWHYALAALVGLGAFGWQTAQLLEMVAMDPSVTAALSLLVGLIVVAMAIAATWIGWFAARQFQGETGLARNIALAATFYLPPVWLCFLGGAPQFGWIMIEIAAVPLALYLVHCTASAVERGPECDQFKPLSAWSVLAERLLQGMIVLLAAVLAASAWGVDLQALSRGETMQARIFSGVIEALIVLLSAEVAWQVVRALIDVHLHRVRALAPDNEAHVRRRARTETLLPFVRNAVLVTIAVVAVLASLSALGLQIGPLIAGASVIGVAIGFGAQALVRDVISGFFFLLEDAFRVGEYIETGALRGTVDAFTPRSIRLRDYKGQLHTVPFGEMRTVTNHSREWVNEELQIGVPHGTDIELVERALNEAGERLSADEQLGPKMIAPLTSLGITGISDYAIRITLVVKTRPGDQFAARAGAYREIARVFAAHGIRLASPTMVIARPGAPGAAGPTQSESKAAG